MGGNFLDFNMGCGVTILLGLIFIRNLNNLAEYIDLKISDGVEKIPICQTIKIPIIFNK
jgi:hypothetical protein